MRREQWEKNNLKIWWKYSKRKKPPPTKRLSNSIRPSKRKPINLSQADKTIINWKKKR
jgi:hypothetical protein